MPGEDNSCTQRAHLTITIGAKPFHRFPVEFRIDTAYGMKQKVLRNVIRLDDPDVRDLFSYILGWGQRPRLLRSRIHYWQMWRPKQRIDGLVPEFIGGPLAKLHKIFYVFALLLIFLAFSVSGTSDETALPVLFITASALAACGYALSRRAHFIRNEGRPLGDPRLLTLVDSWQTVVFGAAEECSRIREGFLRLSTSAQRPDFDCHMEKLWHWGIDGKEEREQVVLTFKRGIVFCQIYQYGRDLYVGWDGHLNKGQWAEQTITTGIDSSSWSVTSVNMVTPGTQLNTEYDVIDLNCLMEWTHAQLVRLLKDLMQEKKIEQEIDFTILRGQRQGLSPTSDGKRKAGFVRELLRRTG
ncbi:MAG: hypothetical protein U0233_14415 [Nitrospira sp.]